MQQLTLEDAERQWHIDRLTRSMARWRETRLDERLPEEYARYCATLEHIKAGGAYVVRNVTEELLREMGRGICEAVKASDRVSRVTFRKQTERRVAQRHHPHRPHRPTEPAP